MSRHTTSAITIELALFICCCLSSAGDDWPTFQHDNARTGVTSERLNVPLKESWTYQAMHAPRPAWPEPAPRDIWHEIPQLKPTVIYDRAFHVVSVGDKVFFGSSADDSVRALDAATGRGLWAFLTEGPVRLAPAVSHGKVYVGSDDGCVYCLDANDGRLVWKYAVDAGARQFPGNGRMISTFPVRTSVVIDEDKAFFFAGLFPEHGVYGCALNAADGSVIWREQSRHVSPQGYLLASPTRLFVPTGRTMPALFDKDSGKCIRTLEGTGGTYALLADEEYMYSLADREGLVGLSDTATGERIATFDGLHMIVKRKMAYLHTQTELASLNRVRHTELAIERNAHAARVEEIEKQLKNAVPEEQKDAMEQERADSKIAIKALDKEMDACYEWRQPCDCPYALILAGDMFLAGGENKVAAFRRDDGERVWTAAVRGKAYGLAVANGRLYVSTDQGMIHCFTTRGEERGLVADTPVDGAPYPEDASTAACTEAAERIIEKTGIRKGHCLVLGCGEGRLAYELAKRTELHIVGVEPDARKAAAAREALSKAGLNGVRVAIHEGMPTDVPYGTYLFNLIVSEQMLLTGEPPCSADEVLRLLRPYGGVACLGQLTGSDVTPEGLRQWLQAGNVAEGRVVEENGIWAEIRRGPVPNSGEWTQLYANSAHTACSGDEVRGPMAIQWFGEPGPRRIIDRHHRPMSSLFKDGRLFVPGDDVLFAVDPYNGTPLWELDVPSMRRVGALKNCGHITLTDKELYIAVQNTCWVVDVDTGERRATWTVPQLMEGQTCDWGYLDQVDDRLFGTGQAAGASFNVLHLDTVNMIEGDFRPVVVSRYLFSMDRFTGEPRWTYRNGAIMNNAIAIGDGRIYFVESRNETAVGDDDGRIGIQEFCAGETFLVALDIKNGKKIYEQAVTLPFHHILYLNYGENTVLVTGSYNVEDRVYYRLFAFEGNTGASKWSTEYQALDSGSKDPAATEGSHGEQWQHPVIIGSRIYSRPYDFDLHTGEKGVKWIKRGGGGCGGLTGSAYYLFGRGSNPRMYDLSLDLTEGEPLTRVSRPGCWLNIIPAGGLVLIPESSSGCTCAYPMQTSLALVPQAVCSRQ